ncbi:hypothetical protein PR003_g3821 [Phytophthora rubi]|uniref:Uncharacterized protein n=1 Tax=Phytophthora rubi TaxID=129364 RepID=A0A6A3L515_9STRA|nr:hypothetical protein PR002_g15568 [Phytophthora rubi]KAE9014702.1 hypothetical protein PR001_g15072 [Phytophthora rubi]KAE9353539.1 hypothetical protein PR003_g3821 [Phytophthora rubi]
MPQFFHLVHSQQPSLSLVAAASVSIPGLHLCAAFSTTKLCLLQRPWEAQWHHRGCGDCDDVRGSANR